MSGLKTLRTRIKSVKNTRQITKTMKMVAAAKVRRARTAVEAARPYAQKLSEVLANLSGGSAGGPLLMTGRKQVKAVRLIVIGTDRGLCGGLNSNLLKAAYVAINQQQSAGRTVQLVAVGRKIRDAFKSTHKNLLVASHTDMGRMVEVEHAQTIAAEALAAFEAGEVDEVHVLYSAMQSMLTQTPTQQQIIPFSSEAEQDSEPLLRATPEYEPGEEEVLAKLLPLNLNMQVFSAMLDTQASEHAARMSAMDSATRNAGEMIKRLSLQYNRSRQAAITKELIEIISGAEAL
ncbi:MAG: F0F1 ATP synthase subunit gamma [Pseudomonadaceae bacterium]|nr:F0F1 ATP synthase subunit gamma [Pseudomonadaceae bacterium]